MQLASARPRILHRFNQHWVRKEIAILDHQVDTRDVHVHNASGANIQMADFTIAHLAFGQPDKRPAGVDQSIWILAQQPVIGRLARERNSVGLGFGAVSPAIEDDKDERFGTRHRSALSSWLLAPRLEKIE